MVLESNTLDVLFVKDGQQGEDGKVLYTWIKYAKDANGTGMTDDPNGAIYIGISYNNESSIESNDPTQYAWTKIQGADGKKGEDAYTIFLENENISFATDKNRNPLSEQAYTSGITIMKGAKPVTDFTIGDIAKTQGIAVAKTDTAIAISVVNGNSLPNDSGEIEIPITVDGTVFKKILTWTCAKKGDQGEKGLQGIQGPQGEQGIAGKDGTSVTIINKSITYQLSTSGTTIPTGTWQTNPQTIPEGQYQWTKTSVTYSDGNKTESYSISYHGKNGSDGTSVKTTSTSVRYQVGDSGTTKPTGTWQSNVPTVAQGKYLWTQTIVNYSDGNSTESYGVSYRGIDGSNGVNGMNAATIYLYQRATSTPSKPSNTLTYTFSTTKITGTLNNGWSTAIPTGTDAVYVTVASVSSKNDTATIATSAWSAPVVLAQNGKTGSDGKAGLNVATIYLYQRNTSKPSKPSASVTYTFSTGVASGLNNGWSQKIPDGTNPLYVTLATASSNTATDTILSSEWSDVVVMAQNGEDGISPKVSLSKTGGTTTISIVDATGTHTQTVKDGINGTPGEAGKDGKTSYFHVKYSNDGGKTFTGNSGEDTGIYMGSYTDYTEADSTDVSKYTWVKVKGDKGDTGQKGQNAKNLSITPSSQYFKSTDGGKTFAPNAITIKPTIQGEISFGKWQYSIDGGVSFTDVVSGQKGLTISNNVLTVSKDSSLYSDAVTMVTFRAVASDSSFYDTCSIAKIYDVSDIQIGGRNLVLNSDKEYVMGYGIPNTTWTDGYAYIGLPTTRLTDEILPQNNAFLLHPEAGNTYTQTIWIETDANIIDLNAAKVSWFTGKYGHVPVTAKIIKLADNSYKLTSTYTVTKGDSDIRLFDILHLFSALDISNSGTYLKFGKLKVEQGNVSTDWTPAPEDVQTAILSTKSEISDVSLKVDNNKQAIEQRVEKTTYQQDLKLVKGDISKANEGLNKWRYEIYPKSLFTSEYQGKSTMDVFAKNTNLTPSQSVLINDTDFGKNWAYGDNYIGYALTFVKFSAAKSVAITFKHDDGAHLYLNGKLIGGDDTCNTGSGESLTLSFIQGWNCLEVVLNEKSGGEYIGLGTTISAISECQLMNCYYGTPVARQSHITNQLVQNTTDIDGVSGSVQKVMSTVGGSGKIDEFVSNYATWKKKVDGIETRVGETYTTKDDFDDLQIGGRNLLKHSSMIGEKLICDNYFICNNCNIQEYTNDGFHIITPTEGNANNGIAFAFDNFTIMEINGGDTITFSCDIKGTSDSHAPFVSIHISDNNWYGSGVVQKNTSVSITKDWQRVSVTITTPTGLTKNHMWLAIHGNHQSDLYVRNFKLEKGNKPTDWTPAPEDVNGKIVNVETIANQTADKFSWIVKSGTSSSNFEIADRLMNLVSANINLDGIVSFMNTAKGDGRKNLYNLDYSSFENVASQEDAICYAKDNGVTSVGIDSSVSYDGDKSLKISYTTANLNSSTTPLYLGSSANNYGCVKIQAGKQYILSCYVKSDSTTGLFMIDIQGHDTPDTKTDGLYLSNIDPRKLPGSSTGVNLSTDWQRAVCAIKVADNATGLYWSVVPLIWGKPSSSSAPKTFNIWVDCIMLEEVDSISNEPGTYILDKETIIDGGSVKADTITGNQILAGSITADKIATDAIKSRNYDSSGGTQGSFLNLGDGSFTSPNLSWDSNGNLIAKNANIIGNLTAGTVGEWKIDKYIYSRDKMFFDINKHNGQSIYNKNSTNNLFLGDGKVSSFYWFTTQNNTFIIENGNSPQYATGPAGISFGTNIAQGQIELYESVYPGNIIQDYEQTSHTSELSISGSKISFSYYDSNGSSFSDSPYTYIMADYARFYGDIFVQGSITTDEGVDVGGKLQASSIATKNGGLIETAGTVYGGGEIQCGGGQMRIIGGNYGILLRNDGSDFYILSTDSGSPWGSWNSKRPFRINLANGIPYFEYGIIIPNENYLLGNGYQLARGTSWGGVCIGDDSKRLRLYGTSIWASHSISTSDENLKENFTTLDQYEEFYMNLNPIGFNYIGDYDGKKTHFGFGAHKIEDILESEGYDADKFAVVTHRPLVQEDIEKRFGKDVTVDIETEYGVSYAEFIALNTHMIQKTRRELTKVKQEKADLEARLQIIEAKLGL